MPHSLSSNKALEKRDTLQDKIGYEVFNFALCAFCRSFSFNNSKENVEWGGVRMVGNCSFLKSKGAYNGVMASAVCNHYRDTKNRPVGFTYEVN